MVAVLFAVVVIVALLIVSERWGKALAAVAVMLVLTLPLVCYAADNQPAVTPGWLGTIGALLLPALKSFIGDPLTWAVAAGGLLIKFVVNTRYWNIIHGAIDMAFHWVEDAKAQGKLPAGLSKEAAALEKLEEILNHKGYSVSDAVIELAKIAWGAMNFKQAQAVEIAKAASPS